MELKEAANAGFKVPVHGVGLGDLPEEDIQNIMRTLGTAIKTQEDLSGGPIEFTVIQGDASTPYRATIEDGKPGPVIKVMKNEGSTEGSSSES